MNTLQHARPPAPQPTVEQSRIRTVGRRGDMPDWMRRRPGVHVRFNRGTTANISSLYPFHGGNALAGNIGPVIGTNITNGGSAWHYDPFELYGRNLGNGAQLTNSNLIIIGEPGSAKSSAIKTMLYRAAGYYQNRFIAVSDPKGEYRPLAEQLQIPIVKLHPGGTDRINVLDPGTGDPIESLLQRQELTNLMLAHAAGRELNDIEQAVLALAIEHLDHKHRTRNKPPDLHDLATLLTTGTSALANDRDLVDLPRDDLARAVLTLKLALSKLLRHTLRGMVDGQSTVRIDWASGPGIVFDLSGVFSNTAAFPLVQMVANSWLTSQMANLQHQGLQAHLVEDEVWAGLADVRTVKALQTRQKLCRLYGIANYLIAHNLANFSSQADDGTAAAKIANGFLADTQTILVFRQQSDQIPLTKSRLRLNDRQAELLPKLTRGRALWIIGDRRAIIQHTVAAHERHLTNTDLAMTV